MSVLFSLPELFVGRAAGGFLHEPGRREGDLREMVKSSDYENEARIMVVSMQKAYTMVKAGPRSTGYVSLCFC